MTETHLHREFGPLLLRVSLIVAAVVWIYSPAFRGDWIWDDAGYLASHLHLHDPAGWWKTWLKPGGGDYYPLESTVLFVQWRLWHNETLGYHLTNVLLHIASALLVWRLLGKLGVRPAWLGGLIFAIHPIMVESVAWIVELKNTLSLPPLLLAMCAYLDYDKKKQPSDYRFALGFFLVAMLCKTSVMMFPAVVLIHAWWKRGRIGANDLKASAPFFAISLLLALPEAWLQHQNGARAVVTAGALARLDTAGWQLLLFFSRSLFPVGLLPIYPNGWVASPSAADFLPWVLFAGLLGIAWLKRDGWGRHALLGLGFFLLNLAPVLAFIWVNAATMIWSMDHLVYVPIIGLIGLAAAGWGEIEARSSHFTRLLVIGATAAAITLPAWASHGYAKLFSNEEVLWNYTLLHNPASALARTNLGVLLVRQGRIVEAKQQFEQALRIDSRWGEAGNNLGLVLEQMGRFREAEARYKKVLSIDPDYAEAHNNLGLTLTQTGRLPEAIEQFQAAVRLHPDDFKMRYNLADSLSQANRLPGAMEQFEAALKINPDFAEAHYGLGNALVQAGRLPEAIAHYEQAVRINPDFADAHANLGSALLEVGQIPGAVDQYINALRIAPRDVDVRATLGLVLMKTGRLHEATAQFEAILKIDPRNANARDGLARIKKMTPATSPGP